MQTQEKKKKKKKFKEMSELTDAELGKAIRDHYHYRLERCRKAGEQPPKVGFEVHLNEDLLGHMRVHEIMDAWRDDQRKPRDTFGAYQALDVLLEEPLTWKHVPGSGRTESIRTFTRDDLPNLPVHEEQREDNGKVVTERRPVIGLIAVPKTLKKLAEFQLSDYMAGSVESDEYIFYEFCPAMFEGASMEDGTVGVIAEQLEYEFCAPVREAMDWLFEPMSQSPRSFRENGEYLMIRACNRASALRSEALGLDVKPAFLEMPKREEVRAFFTWVYERDPGMFQQIATAAPYETRGARLGLYFLRSIAGPGEQELYYSMEPKNPPGLLEDFVILRDDDMRPVFIYGDDYLRHVGRKA